jgi:hypothetical protein
MGVLMHLSMNLLIKNEADIIAENIHVHAALGVDSFGVVCVVCLVRLSLLYGVV